MLRRLTSTNTGKATVRSTALVAHTTWVEAAATWINDGRIPLPILLPLCAALVGVAYRALLEAERRWPWVGRIAFGAAGGPTYEA